MRARSRAHTKANAILFVCAMRDRMFLYLIYIYGICAYVLRGVYGKTAIFND